METKLSEQEILKDYEQGDDAYKAMLEKHYGKEMFIKKGDYTELKTVDDCRKKLYPEINTDEVKVTIPPALSKYKDALQATLEAFIVRDAIADNEEVKLGQRRYWPYFYEKPGVGFRFISSYYDFVDTFLGSRLEFSDAEQSKYFGEQFLDIHKRRLGF